LNVAKSLLHQLLNLRVGDIHIYRVLVQSYQRARQCADPKQYEDHLWHALAEIFKYHMQDSNDTIIVVDGLDELFGGKSTGQGLFDKLVQMTGHAKSVKLVGLSQSLSIGSGARGSHYTITANDTRDDIHSVLIKSLLHCHHFHGKPGPEQESIIGRIISASAGSFLTAILFSEVLKIEKSEEDFTKTVQTLQKTRPTLQELVSKLLSVLQPTHDSMILLSWLVDAARPLTYEEISSLFSINTQQATRSERRFDVHSIVQSIRPLLSIHEDIVCVRHVLVQNILQTLFDQGKLPLPVKDRHMDFLLRALIYTKAALSEKGEPTLDDSDHSLPAKLFHRHPFLEYVIRYWVSHWKQTPSTTVKTGSVTVSSEVRKIFPNTTIMPILEWLCWDDQFPGAEELDLHILVSHIRREILTENHPAVLQSYLNCATYYEVMDNGTEASKIYFTSTIISRTVLGSFHPLTTECAGRYLRLTESMITTSRTEVMTHREQIIIILIEAYEHQFGKTSDIVIQTRQLLADLYIHIHEDDRAYATWSIIRSNTVDKHGKDSNQARELSEHLRLKLSRGKGDRTLETYKDNLFTDDDEEDEEHIEVFDLQRAATILRRAETSISQKKLTEAEAIYVELWQQLSKKCRTTRSIEWHETKIDTVYAYSKLLSIQKRDQEAAAILACLWQEYEHHELAFSEIIISRLTECAQMLKSGGHYAVALSIFKHASSYYKSVKKEESRDFLQIQKEIEVTSTEIVKHTVSSSSSTANLESVSESMFEQIFKSIMTNKSKSVDAATIKLANRLTSQYMEQKKWSEAIAVIELTLQRTWPSFLSTYIHEVTLTSTFLQESIEQIECLAECFLQQRLPEKVEDIYLRLFRAILSSPQKDGTLLAKMKNLLVNFYDKHGYSDRAISVLQEVLVVYRKTYGQNHELTIQTLYTLATRCSSHPRSHPYWIEYYQQIVVTLNKDSDICHPKAMQAIINVANSYWEERRYAEAVTVYFVIWHTFLNKTKDYKEYNDAKFVEDTYERYFKCLEETNADFDVLYSVTKQYHEASISAFGSSSSTASSATLALARVSQRSEKHIEEALSLYEQISKKFSSSSSSSSTTSKSTEIIEIKRSMATLYNQRIITKSFSTTSTETIQKAINIYKEQFSETKSKYGYSHEMTLSNLKELSMLYVRQKNTEAAIKELTAAIVEINIKEQSSQTMLESATSIAEMFEACQQTNRCTEIINELHRQIIAKDSRNSSKFGFDLTKCTTASLIFIASLEYNTRAELSTTYSEIISNIIAESVLYENFRRVLKANSSLDKIVIAASPLRYVLNCGNRKELASSVEEQVVQLFIRRDISKMELLSRESPHIFMIGILDHIGNRKDVNFVQQVVIASNNTLTRLVNASNFKDAYDIANIAFTYAQYHNAYHNPKAISRGFKLASYLDGRGENKCPEEGLRKELLQLSNNIIKEILKICKDQKINLAQVQLRELNELIALLGEQQDFKTLEASPKLCGSLFVIFDAYFPMVGPPNRPVEHS
jgi:tetratricopeptide (TPR) repeat protein